MAPINLKTDGELLADFAETGSQAAFTEMVQRYGTMVYGVSQRILQDHHEAQDVAQAVFLTLARKAGALRRGAPIGGWLHHVAVCLARDFRSARWRRQRRDEQAMNEIPSREDPALERRAFQEEMDTAIGQLPERYRQPLRMFHLEGRSLEEISQTLGLNLNTVCTRLARARELLRLKLVRRGVTVGSVGALTVLLSAESGAVVLPPTFVASTVGAATGGAVSTTVAALIKGALKMLFLAKVKTVSLTAAACLVVAGTGVVAAKQLATTASAPPAPGQPSVSAPALPEPSHIVAEAQPSPTPAPAQPQAAPVAAHAQAILEGEKVLAQFWHYPVVEIGDKGPPAVDAEYYAAREKTHQKILDAAKGAGVEVLRSWNTEDKAARLTYGAMLLLDCKGQSPEKVVRTLPDFVTGIVFQNGQYQQALPVETVSKWSVTVKKGQVPAPYAFYVRGGSAYVNLQQGQQDVKRFKTMPEVIVEAFAPPAGQAGGGWMAKLTPAPGRTLLEVFLLTETRFQMVNP